MFVENASFLRMDNLTVGYNVGEFMGKGTNLRINAMAQNVFVITKYKGIDPEIFNGVDNGFYQRPKVYSLGFKLSILINMKNKYLYKKLIIGSIVFGTIISAGSCSKDLERESRA